MSTTEIAAQFREILAAREAMVAARDRYDECRATPTLEAWRDACDALENEIGKMVTLIPEVAQ
jgi:hypothetical protein